MYGYDGPVKGICDVWYTQQAVNRNKKKLPELLLLLIVAFGITYDCFKCNSFIEEATKKEIVD
jgi:hypothetical protein